MRVRVRVRVWVRFRVWVRGNNLGLHVENDLFQSLGPVFVSIELDTQLPLLFDQPAARWSVVHVTVGSATRRVAVQDVVEEGRCKILPADRKGNQ